MRKGQAARRAIATGPGSSLAGTFGPIEIAVPRARLNAADGKTREWKSRALRAYQRRALAADALIASTYLAGTNTRRVRRALRRPVRRRGRQGHGEPRLAQGEERLGRLECSRAARRTDCAAHSRRHGGGCAARPQGDRDPALGRRRRAHGWPEGAASGQDMGGESNEA